MSHPVAGHQDDPDPFAGLWQAVVTSSKVPSPVIAMGGGRHAGPSCSIASFVLTENDNPGFRTAARWPNPHSFRCPSRWRACHPNSGDQAPAGGLLKYGFSPRRSPGRVRPVSWLPQTGSFLAVLFWPWALFFCPSLRPASLLLQACWRPFLLPFWPRPSL